MTRPIQPSQLDIENAACRQEIADRFRREYEEARTLAEAVFGPGWEPCGRHMLVDKDEEERRRTEGGTMRFHATVYSARKGDITRHFMLTDGKPIEVPSYQEGFGAMLTEPHPTKGFEHQGRWIPFHRYTLCWSGFEPDYRPKSAEQLAAARAKREQQAVEKEAEAHPLFADLIRAEGYIGKKGRGR